MRNRAEPPEFATSQEATEDDPGVPEDLWEVDDDEEVNVNPTKSRPVFIRETKKTVKELFETLLESMESVEGEKVLTYGLIQFVGNYKNLFSFTSNTNEHFEIVRKNFVLFC